MIESSVEDWICGEATRAGWYCRKVKWAGRRNAPDRLFAKDGRMLFIEFKRVGRRARIAQQREIIQMRAAGLEVHVVDSPMRALAILDIDYAPPGQ